MKTFTHYQVTLACLCFLSFLFPPDGNAQYPGWSTAQAVTDSSVDNLNATIFQSEYPQDLLFWERHVDDNTSEICMRNIYDTVLSDTQVVLSQPMTLFTNPVILKTGGFSDNSDFYLFYETNEGNSTDIKYIKHYISGTFSEPFILTDAPGIDVNLQIGAYAYIVSWENEGKILLSVLDAASHTYGTPVLVDNNGSYSPAFFEAGFNIAWLKNDGLNSYLKFADVVYQSGSILIQNIDSVELNGDAVRLTAQGNLDNMIYTNSLAFQKREYGSDKWGLCFADFSEIPPVIINHHSSSYSYLSPALWEILIGVDAMENMSIAFTSDSLGNTEVFAVYNWFYADPDNIVNISNYAGEDINPSISLTWHSFSVIRYQLYWESFRNGHWVICRSFVDIPFGSIDQSLTGDNLVVSPNPFKDHVSLRFKSISADNWIKIFHLNGQCVGTLKAIADTEGWLSVTWDGRDNRGNKAPAGSYIVVFPTGKGVAGKIILKSE